MSIAPTRLNAIAKVVNEDTNSSYALNLLIAVLAIGMVGFHILQLLQLIVPSGQLKNIHLGISLLICFLMLASKATQKSKSKQIFWIFMALLTLIPSLYIHLEYDSLIGARALFSSNTDLLIGLALLILTLIATAAQWGLVIPIVGIVSILYAIFGYIFPGEVLYHGGVSITRIIGYTSIPQFRGLFGGLLEVSANMIFIFMVFAGMLKALGGMDLVLRLSFGLSSKSRSGPAQAAVVGSAFMGMISGSAMANVASTGAFTIPLMKRLGFEPKAAGAIEAVASTGGQITPPTLGLAAFLIVGITGIPYSDIVIATIIPAAIFYLYLLIAVHIYAVRIGIKKQTKLESDANPLPLSHLNIKTVLLQYGHLIIGLIVLTVLLMTQLPAGIAATYAIFTLIGLELIKQIIVHKGNLGKGLLNTFELATKGFIEGAVSGAQMAIVIAVLGVMVEIFVATGFAQKLSYLMLSFAQDDFWLLLLAAGGACLAFGVGMPTPAAYILVALLGAPALIEFGVPVLSAHLYLFFMANMSSITPPVATGALVAAQLAGANFFSTCFVALRLALPGFLLPIAFVIHPEILGINASVLTQLSVGLITLIALVGINVAVEGALFKKMNFISRFLILLSVAGLVMAYTWSLIAALILLAGVALLNYRQSQQSNELLYA